MHVIRNIYNNWIYGMVFAQIENKKRTFYSYSLLWVNDSNKQATIKCFAISSQSNEWKHLDRRHGRSIPNLYNLLRSYDYICIHVSLCFCCYCAYNGQRTASIYYYDGMYVFVQLKPICQARFIFSLFLNFK